MHYQGLFPQTRLRRLRQTPMLRGLVRETEVTLKDMVLPLFIRHGQNIKSPINSMPGHFQLSLDKLSFEIGEIQQLGIQSILLFGIPESKDAHGKDSYSDDGIIQKALRLIKKQAPDLLVISDVCFCEYTDHGHCGILTTNHEVDNDSTLPYLVMQAISHAKAGADIIAPSGMMDGAVAAIRRGLDDAGFLHIPILSYSVKYSSAMYGPFREAAEGAPKFGDRRTHQMDYGNAKEAIRECALDIAEGADMLMVKPAHTYLDVIYRIKSAYPSIPLGAYHTSGEFAMIKAAAAQGWIDEQQTVMEVLTAIKRAGADFIISYYTKEMALWHR